MIMTFGDILNKASVRAFQMGKTLVFGGTEVQNVAANEISDDFFTLDVSSGSYVDPNVPNAVSYTIVVRCMGVSAYMRDDAVEIETLVRTDLLMQEFLKSFICGYEISGIRLSKVQNQYDSIKSGWEATLDIS